MTARQRRRPVSDGRPRRRRTLLHMLVGTAASIGVVAASTVVMASTLAVAQPGVPDASEHWTPVAAESTAPPTPARFVAPNDVHRTDDGALLVADFAGNGLLRRSVDGTWRVVAPFGTQPTDLWNPSAVTTTDDGTIVVAEAGRPAIAVLGAAGSLLTRSVPPPTDGHVSELAVAGRTLFAAVPGSGAVWTSGLGSGSWSTVPGPWTDPSGVAVSSDGRTLTVSDRGADEVWQLDRGSDTAASLGFPGDPQTSLSGVTTADGDVFVVDNRQGRVWARTDGRWTIAFSTAPDGSPLVDPVAVTVGPDRSLVVADYNRQRVVTAESDRGVAAAPVPVAGPTAPPTAPPTSPAPTRPTPTASEAPVPGAPPVPGVPGTGRAPDATASAAADPSRTATAPPVLMRGDGGTALARTGGAALVPGLVASVALMLVGVGISVLVRARRRS